MPLHSGLPILLAPAFVRDEYQGEEGENRECKRRATRRIFVLRKDTSCLRSTTFGFLMRTGHPTSRDNTEYAPHGCDKALHV